MRQCRPSVVRQLEAEPAKRTPLRPEVCWHLDEAFLALENRVADDHEKLPALGQAHPQCRRWQAMPGGGPLTATALLAAVPDAAPVKHGRPWATWLGLVPREHATGGTPRRLGMSPRGDGSLRKRLVQGARAPRRWAVLQNDPRRPWGSALIARRGKNRAAVA